MGSEEFINRSKEMINNYVKEKLDAELIDRDIYVVWLCKTLQNNKGMFSTTIPDTRYYEVTFNGDKKEFYFDAYVKEKNICYSL